MKSTDLQKLNGLKIRGRMKNAGTPDRFGRAASGDDAKSRVNPLIEKLLKKGLGDKDAK